MDVTFSAAGLRLKVTAAEATYCAIAQGTTLTNMLVTPRCIRMSFAVCCNLLIFIYYSVGTPFQVDPHIVSGISLGLRGRL